MHSAPSQESLASSRPVSTAIKALKDLYGPDFSIQNITGYSALSGGLSGAPTYLIRTNKDYFAIKAYSPEQSVLAQQVQLVEQTLADAGIFVPPPIISSRRDDGSLLLVRRFVEGDTVSSITLEQSRQLAATLADAHNHLAALLEKKPEIKDNVAQSSEVKGTLPIIKNVIRRSASLAASSSFETAKQHTLNIIGQRNHTGIREGLIHNDLHLRNVLFSEDKPVIIDWDGLTYGPILRDIAKTMVRCIFEPAALGKESTPLKTANGFLQSYHQIAPLTPEEIKLFPSILRREVGNNIRADIMVRPKATHAMNAVVDDYLRQTDLFSLLGVEGSSRAR